MSDLNDKKSFGKNESFIGLDDKTPFELRTLVLEAIAEYARQQQENYGDFDNSQEAIIAWALRAHINNHPELVQLILETTANYWARKETQLSQFKADLEKFISQDLAHQQYLKDVFESYNRQLSSDYNKVDGFAYNRPFNLYNITNEFAQHDFASSNLSQQILNKVKKAKLHDQYQRPKWYDTVSGYVIRFDDYPHTEFVLLKAIMIKKDATDSDMEKACQTFLAAADMCMRINRIPVDINFCPIGSEWPFTYGLTRQGSTNEYNRHNNISQPRQSYQATPNFEVI